MKYLALIAALFCTGSALAQNYNMPVKTVAPVTPNSAALFKVQEHPIGPFTGTTPINIPLYSISAGELQTAVTMDYSNGGIKVEEIASWIGLGWNLSAGGRISRVMKGIPDDHGGMLTNTTFKPSQFIPTSEQIVGTYFGNLDLEPDIYYFNVNGLSGKFFFNEQGVPQLVSKKPLQINYILQGNTIKNWIITDENGTKYYFGRDSQGLGDATDDASVTFNNTSTMSNTFTYISAWHLVEIRDMAGKNSIKFSYVKSYTSFTTLPSETLAIGGFFNVEDCKPSDQAMESGVTASETYESYLSTIEGSQGKLVFESSPDRLDYAGGRKLNYLKLYDAGNNLLRQYAFDYSYFTEAGAPIGTLPDLQYKRLKLNKITELDGAGINGGFSHKFDYEELINLPSRISKAVDYWGYYNGKWTNTTYLPSGTYRVGTDSYTRENLADRRANPSYAVANTLKKITYPTGGSRQFVYEGNKALLEQYSQIKPDVTDYEEKRFSEVTATVFDEFTPSFSVEFTINSENAFTSFSYDLRGFISGNFEVRLSYAGVDFGLIETYLNNKNGSRTLGNGTYKIEVYQDPTGYFTSFEGIWVEKHSNIFQIDRYGKNFTTMSTVGGIRVKELIDVDPVTNAALTTKYEYNLFSNPALTSGLLISPLKIAYRIPLPTCYSLCTLSSTSNYPLVSEGGSHVAYPEVRTIQQNNGHIDREYSFAFEEVPFAIPQNPALDVFPLAPPADGSWMRSQLISEKYYDQNNILLKRNLNAGIYYSSAEWDITDYRSVIHNDQIAYKFFARTKVDNLNNEYIDFFKTTLYYLYSVFTAPLGSKNITYTNGLEIEERTEYDYYMEIPNPVLKQQRTYLSNGTVRYTIYKYAFNSVNDFVFGLSPAEQAIKADLLLKNYLQPLETVVIIKAPAQADVIAGGAKISFDYFNGTLYLSKVKKYTSATDFSETIYDKYSVAKGNLLQYHQDKSIPVCYLYSYNGQYPIAEIRNAEYTAVENVLTTTAIDNFTALPNPDRTTIESFIATLKTALSNAFITTYSYKPLVGILSQTDPKGMTTSYEYDSFGRLNVIKDQNGNIVKSYCYNYAGQLTNCSPAPAVYYNDAVSGSFTRNNCPSGSAGSTVTYTIAQNSYSATTTVAANALAAAALASGGQAYANSNGTCTPVQTCKTFKLTVSPSVSSNVYVKYMPCGSSSYIVVALNSLDAEIDDDGNRIIYLGIEPTLPYFEFRNGASGPTRPISGIEIEEI